MRAGDLVQTDTGHVWAVAMLVDGAKVQGFDPTTYAFLFRATNLGHLKRSDEAELVSCFVPARELRVVADSNDFIFAGRKFLHDGEPAVVLNCDDTKFVIARHHVTGEAIGTHRWWMALSLFHRIYGEALDWHLTTFAEAAEDEL